MAVGIALPPCLLRQEDAAAWGERIGAGRPDLQPCLDMFRTAGIRERHFALSPGSHVSGKTPGMTDLLEQGTALAAEAARLCLRKVGEKPEHVEHLFLATSSCWGAPGPEVLLARRLELRGDVRRSPLFGLGGAGGAAALARAFEYLKGHPRHRALVVAVDLCDRIFSPEEFSPATLAAAAIFGDGAAAALLGGDEVPAAGPRILGVRSLLLEGAEDLAGGGYAVGGFRPSIPEGLPDLLAGPLRKAVEDFLLSWAMNAGRIRHWILPPGGEEVMEVYREEFGLSETSLQPTTGPMERSGDVVGAFPLLALGDLLSGGRPRPGDKGLLAAVGPGPAAELLLLGW